MTDTGSEHEHSEHRAPEAAPTTGAGNGMGSEFTSGEGLIALAGIVLLVVWLIFDVFLDEFGIADIEFLLAVTVVVVPRLDRSVVEKIHKVPVIMKTAGYAIAVLGAFYIISAIEGGFYSDALTIIGALVSYAAYAMAFLGARSVKT